MSEQINTQWTADTIQDFLRDHSEELKAMGVVKIGLFGELELPLLKQQIEISLNNRNDDNGKIE